MADFCRQCSLDTFGEDYRDLGDITSAADWAEGRAACALCEGCGPIQVDPDGCCASSDCLQEGAPGHGVKWNAYKEPV